jgi:hypothetical protein
MTRSLAYQLCALATAIVLLAYGTPALAMPAAPDDTTAECTAPAGADYIDPACIPATDTILCGWRLTIDYLDFACLPWYEWAR